MVIANFHFLGESVRPSLSSLKSVKLFVRIGYLPTTQIVRVTFFAFDIRIAFTFDDRDTLVSANTEYYLQISNRYLATHSSIAL